MLCPQNHWEISDGPSKGPPFVISVVCLSCTHRELSWTCKSCALFPVLEMSLRTEETSCPSWHIVGLGRECMLVPFFVLDVPENHPFSLCRCFVAGKPPNIHGTGLYLTDKVILAASERM